MRHIIPQLSATHWHIVTDLSLSFPFSQRKTFAVSHQGRSGGLTLDWNSGFSLNEGEAVIFQFKFSQLRGSSDDGKSKLKLHFQDVETRAIETKVSLSWMIKSELVWKITSFNFCYLNRNSNVKPFRACCSACMHSWQRKSHRSIRNFSTPYSKLEIEPSFHFKYNIYQNPTAVCTV